MFIEPVFGKKFFGREEVLAILHKRATAIKGGYRQNLAIAGPMLTGKSSILRHFLNNLKYDDIVPIYIEMGEESFDVFCLKYMSSILYQYLKTDGETPQSDIKSLMTAARKPLPQTISSIEDIIENLQDKKIDRAYEILLDLTSVFKKESGKNCIVILDEFHNLANFPLKKPFQTLGKFIMTQKNTMYIVSSSQETLLKDILSKKLSLLFGNFELIEVNGFDAPTARSFISYKLSEEEVPETVINYIIEISQANPFYLETIIKHFSKSIKKDEFERDYKECVLHSLTELLYESKGILNQYFSNNINFFLEKRNRKRYVPALIALSKGLSKIKTLQRETGINGMDLRKILKDLTEIDLVDQNGSFYKIHDKLFELWLKNVYNLKMSSIIDDMDIKYLEFKNVMDKHFSDFAAFDEKPIQEIVKNLIAMFADEKASLGGKDKKLPRFDSVSETRISDYKLELLCRKNSKTWLCDIIENELCYECDVTDLAARKRLDDGSKVARKILIPLDGIDHNAFLLAKEKNIWVWSINDINKLLRLFGEFEILT